MSEPDGVVTGIAAVPGHDAHVGRHAGCRMNRSAHPRHYRTDGGTLLRNDGGLAQSLGRPRFAGFQPVCGAAVIAVAMRQRPQDGHALREPGHAWEMAAEVNPGQARRDRAEETAILAWSI